MESAQGIKFIGTKGWIEVARGYPACSDASLERPVKWNPATLSFGDDKEAFAHRLYNYEYRNPYSLCK